eukprot:GHVU01233452.1.p1 GENE.GHVU01233452.1~~GHVU01233452.1.p1  ORF type:complete len:404 (+),score=65.68 GHVU01233452.1:461-1672(+)
MSSSKQQTVAQCTVVVPPSAGWNTNHSVAVQQQLHSVASVDGRSHHQRARCIVVCATKDAILLVDAATRASRGLLTTGSKAKPLAVGFVDAAWAAAAADTTGGARQAGGGGGANGASYSSSRTTTEGGGGAGARAFVLASHSDNSVRLWQLPEGIMVAHHSWHSAEAQSLVVRGTTCITGDRKGTLCVWNVAHALQSHLHSHHLHLQGPIDLSPTGAAAAASSSLSSSSSQQPGGGGGGTVFCPIPQPVTCLAAPPPRRCTSNNNIDMAANDWDAGPDATLLVVGYRSGAVALMDTQAREVIRNLGRHDAEVTSVLLFRLLSLSSSNSGGGCNSGDTAASGVDPAAWGQDSLFVLAARSPTHTHTHIRLLSQSVAYDVCGRGRPYTHSKARTPGRPAGATPSS